MTKPKQDERTLQLERQLRTTQDQLSAFRNQGADKLDQILRPARTKAAISPGEPYPTSGTTVPFIFLDVQHSGSGSTVAKRDRSIDRQGYASTIDDTLPPEGTEGVVFRYTNKQWFFIPTGAPAEDWVTIKIHNTTPYTLQQWETCQIVSLTNWEDTSPDHRKFPPAGLLDRTFDAVGGGLLMPSPSPPQYTPWHNGLFNDCSMLHCIIRADIAPDKIGTGIIKGMAPGRLVTGSHFVEPLFDTSPNGIRQHGWRDASIGFSSTRSIVRYRWLAPDGQAWGMIDLNQAQDPEFITTGGGLGGSIISSGDQSIVHFWDGAAAAAWGSHPFWRPSGNVLGSSYAGGISFSTGFDAVLDFYLVALRIRCVQGGESIAFTPPALPTGYEWSVSQKFQFTLHQYSGLNEINSTVIDPAIYFEERIQRTLAQSPGSPFNPADPLNDKRFLRVQVPIKKLSSIGITLPETVLLKVRWTNPMGHYTFGVVSVTASASIRIRNFGAYPADQNQNYVRPTWYVPGGGSPDPPLPPPHGPPVAPPITGLAAPPPPTNPQPPIGTI